MKNHDVRILGLLLLSLAFGALIRADEIPYEQILKERDAVLSQMLALQEGRLNTGLADPEMVTAARIALWNFRRDNAGTKEGKIRQQELLVQEHDRVFAAVKARKAAGMGNPLDELMAADKLLEAKQVLAELRMKE
jgi:hypothetical protein